jgi:hypothetical protein
MQPSATSQSLTALLRTPSGTLITGQTYSSLTAYYVCQGAAPVSVSLSALASATTAFTPGGIWEYDLTHMPGLYRIDWPNACWAAGPSWVDLYIQATSGGGFWTERVPIDGGIFAWAGDPAVRFAIPQAAVGAIGGLVGVNAGLGLLNTDNLGNLNLTAASLSAIWQDVLTSGDFAVTGSIGALLKAALPNSGPGLLGGLPVVDSSNRVKALDSGGNQFLLTNDFSGHVSANNQRVIKNAPLNATPFFMALNTDGRTPATGLSVTAQRSLNGGAFAPCTNVPTETGYGWYSINLSAADLNADWVVFRFSANTAAESGLQILPQPT